MCYNKRMPKVRMAINGFGRIGRQAFKIALENKKIEVVAINDLTDNETLAHLLKYDSVYGRYDKKVAFDRDHLIVGSKKIPVYEQPLPRKLPWRRHKVDVVIESTGRFVKDGAARDHVRAGAAAVVLSAPAKGRGKIPTYLRSVNDKEYEGEKLISNASCTTNCIAPVMAVMESAFGIEKSMMTTVHGYTADQKLQDGPHRDLRRSRAAALNIIPTTTGAAIATTEVMPQLEGKFDGIAMRVPVAVGSLSDFCIVTKKNVTETQVKNAFKKAAKNPLYKGVLEVTEDAIVSTDIIGNPASSIVDLGFIRVVGGNLVKILAWYDNEYGYANRLVEMAAQVGK